MSTRTTEHPHAALPPALTPGPWWAGRALAAAIVAAGGVATWAGTTDVRPAPTEPLPSNVSLAVEAPVEAPVQPGYSEPRSSEPAPAGAAPADSAPPVAEPARAPAPPLAAQRAAVASRSAAVDLAQRAEAQQRRERARIRRAIRADQELARFVAAAERTTSAASSPSAPEWTSPLTTAYRVSATFGQSGARWSRDHTGIDLAAPSGTSVHAVAAGRVTHAGWDGAYGNKVELVHADGTETWYAHLSSTRVSVGQTVAAGTVIGAVGSTGNSTGPHLHLEVRPAGGGPVDPRPSLAARGVRL